MFIYVMDEESKKYMEEHGYSLLKCNAEGGDATVWVFANKENHEFDDIGVPCVVSDTLTF